MPFLYHKTPCIYSAPLSKRVQGEVFLKLENLQPSASFKNRGIGTYCAQKAHEGATSFVSSSGGNAGLAAAYAGRLLSLPIHVVVPTTSLPLMRHRIVTEGATLSVHGNDWQEADAFARKLCAETQACYVPPFDHPLLWQGISTLIHEIAEEHDSFDALLLSVGGGGLLCGTVQGMHAVGWNNCPVYAVETEGAASFAAAQEKGTLVELEKIDTIAASLGARKVCAQALSYSQEHALYSRVVSDQEALDACLRFSEDHRFLVEPCCGASLSLLYRREPELIGRRLLLIVCGGSAVNLDMLIQWRKQLWIKDRSGSSIPSAS